MSICIARSRGQTRYYSTVHASLYLEQLGFCTVLNLTHTLHHVDTLQWQTAQAMDGLPEMREFVDPSMTPASSHVVRNN